VARRARVTASAVPCRTAIASHERHRPA
jgi:hypothetical protein